MFKTCSRKFQQIVEIFYANAIKIILIRRLCHLHENFLPQLYIFFSVFFVRSKVFFLFFLLKQIEILFNISKMHLKD